MTNNTPNIVSPERPADIAVINVYGADFTVGYDESVYEDCRGFDAVERSVTHVKLGSQWIYAVELLNEGMIAAINSELNTPEEVEP